MLKSTVWCAAMRLTMAATFNSNAQQFIISGPSWEQMSIGIG
jgi:hypothetical protein